MRKGQVAIVYILFFITAVFSQQVVALNEVKLHQEIEWTKVKGFSLTTDIYSPQNKAKPLPVLVIFHGGGWLVNNKSIMKDMALYMASHADLVVVNMNYRLLGDNNNSTTINEIVEDALGAVLWVKDHIHHYGGDPAKIAVTGDSAGGHLASMVMLASRSLDSKGFTPQSQKFTPSYLPKGKTAEQVAAADGAKVQAVILSYTAFDLLQSAKGGFETAQNPFWTWGNASPRGLFGAGISVQNHPQYYKAVSPLYLLPQDGYRLPPQFVLVGSEDNLTTPEVASRYVSELKAAGQQVEFKIYQGKGHGFLDSGCNDYTKGCFKDLATPTLDDMIKFLNTVFEQR
uniref:Esterase protein n=1 Tax=Rheinheimera sp. Chandigarh TaxID=598548 RepID=D7GNM7_9GAMM|nr:esterase protein [Rheinheimera sp. Chandigarh]